MTSDCSQTSRSARTVLALAASTGLALTVVAGGAQAAGASEDKQPVAELSGAAALSAHKKASAVENSALTVPAAAVNEAETVATVTTAAPGPAEEERRTADEDAQEATAVAEAGAGQGFRESSVAAGVTAAASAGSATSVSAPSPSASGVVGLAQGYLGTPYVYGGTSPAGFDCSGFVQYVYAQAGVSLPRTSYAQGAAGTLVSASEAQPGDIVYYGYHVGIYAGGGMMVDAGSESTGVVYRSVTDLGAPIGYVRIG